jgi:hypothetical protein
MSYLDRLKQKISQDVPRGGATKATEGAFVPFVATRSAPLRQNLSREAASQGWRPNDPELQEGIKEHFEERAAIREYDGHESRKEAEAKAREAMRVYEYRLTDNGPDGPWLILLAPGCNLLEAECSLKNRFGDDRVQDVRERRHG